MKFWLQMMVAVAVTAFASACSTTLANHDYNAAIDFDGYKTFSWISRHPLVAAPAGVNPLLEEQLEQTARDLLTAKGYRFVDDAEQADFVVGFGLGASDKVRIDSYPSEYQGAWRWPGSGGQEVTVRQFVEGRLTVDIFDIATHQAAWHGWATKDVTPKVEKDTKAAIREALTAILAHFPPS